MLQPLVATENWFWLNWFVGHEMVNMVQWKDLKEDVTKNMYYLIQGLVEDVVMNLHHYAY